MGSPDPNGTRPGHPRSAHGAWRCRMYGPAVGMPGRPRTDAGEAQKDAGMNGFVFGVSVARIGLKISVVEWVPVHPEVGLRLCVQWELSSFARHLNKPEMMRIGANRMRMCNAQQKVGSSDVPERPASIPGRLQNTGWRWRRPARQNVTKRTQCIQDTCSMKAIAAGRRSEQSGRRTGCALDGIFISRGLRNALRFLNLSLRSCVFSHKILKKSPLLKKCCNIGPKLAKQKPRDSRKVTTMAFLRGIL